MWVKNEKGLFTLAFVINPNLLLQKYFWPTHCGRPDKVHNNVVRPLSRILFLTTSHFYNLCHKVYHAESCLHRQPGLLKYSIFEYCKSPPAIWLFSTTKLIPTLCKYDDDKQAYIGFHYYILLVKSLLMLCFWWHTTIFFYRSLLINFTTSKQVLLLVLCVSLNVNIIKWGQWQCLYAVDMSFCDKYSFQSTNWIQFVQNKWCSSMAMQCCW